MEKKMFIKSRLFLIAILSMILTFSLPFSSSGAEDSLSDSAFDKMKVLVSVYANSWYQRQLYEEDGIIHVDTSYNEDDFWDFFWAFALFDHTTPVKNLVTREYSYDAVRSIAYSLFPDFSGELPPFMKSLSGGVKIQDNKIQFGLATPEEQELTLQSYSTDTSGGVTATYIQHWILYYGLKDVISVHFTPNSHYDPNNNYSFPYVISSITYTDSENIPDNGDSSEYIFPDSNSRYLTVEDLLPLDAATLRLARNEIYARLGRLFSSEDLQAYFNSKSWYNGYLAPDVFDEAILNDYERTNAYFIQDYENGEINVDSYLTSTEPDTDTLNQDSIFKDGIVQEVFLQDMEGLWECWTYGPKDNTDEYAPLYTARFSPDGLIYNPGTENEYIVEIVSVSLEDGAYRICLRHLNGNEYSYLSTEENNTLWYFNNWEGGDRHFFGTSSMNKKKEATNDASEEANDKPDNNRWLDNNAYEDDYVLQHISYFQNSYSTDILPMDELSGLCMVLEDTSNDLSDALYQSLKTATDLWDFAGIANDVLNNQSYPVNFNDEYTALIYQLVANEASYNDIKSSFSESLQAESVSAVETILSKSEDWYKKGLSAEDVQDAQELFDNNLQLLETLDPESDEFFNIWLDTSDACEQYYDSSKRVEIVNQISERLDLPLSIFSNGLNELKTIGEAFEYITYASAYKKVSDEFKEVLEGIAALAKEKETKLTRIPSHEAYDPFGRVQIYRSIYTAINKWISDMDAYQNDAVAEISNKIITGTAVNVSNLTLDFAVDHILPGLGEIHLALSLGQLGIDVFTTIDDEYKQAIMVTLCDHFSALVIELSERYGRGMIANNLYHNSYEGASGLLAAITKPYEFAQLFDKSIGIYKNTILLACDYGEAYEQIKLNSANEHDIIIINDEEQANIASTAINSICVLRTYMNSIICHK